MELASFQTEDEQNRVLKWLEPFADPTNQSTIFFSFIWVGGVKNSQDLWVWDSTRKSINYQLKWGPNEPNNDGETCLNLWRYTTYSGYDFRFNDDLCDCEMTRGVYLCEFVTSDTHYISEK
jgi:hypothetical protein